MTEVAVLEQDAKTVEAVPNLALTELGQWVDEARAVFTISQQLAKTSFVPKSYQGKAAEVMAAILTGREIGLQPMAALRAMDVIEGKPALSALAMRALVQSRGHRVHYVESTPERCVVAGFRAGDDRPQQVEWTIERARLLGLTGKKNWREQPQSMLVARATAEVCRLIAADSLLGVPYSIEELTDKIADDTSALTSTPVRARRIKRKELPAPPEPELEPAIVDAEQPVMDTEWPEPVPNPEGDGDE